MLLYDKKDLQNERKMQTSTLTVVTSLKRSSADADAMMVALERRIQANAHALAVKREEEEEEEEKKKKKKKRDRGFLVGGRRDGGGGGGGLTQRGSHGARAEKDTNRMTSSSREWWTKETKDDDVHDVHDVHNEAAAAAAAKKETTRGDAKRADAHFRKGLEMLRRNAPKEALGEFEMALERCPVHAKRARKTLENARERAMEMVYSGGTCAEDDDDDDDDEDVLTTSREAGKANEEEKKDVDVDDDEGRAKSSSMSGTKWERKTPTKTNREAIEELYDASRWLLRSTPRDGREAVRLLKMAERMLREDDDEKGGFLDDRERKEIRIAKEKIERAIKLVKR